MTREEAPILAINLLKFSWPRDTPEEPRQLEMACGVRNTSEEILVDVLLRLLPQEEIARNQCQIPLDEYTLKVFGTDEFLVRDTSIGEFKS